ncbi:MAG: bifunctional UDP-N-acetylglucosamine diphosphorylase/glucosamine-1-phosphate N-acetyltransferase GlmU [Pseudomonadota bacterium]
MARSLLTIILAAGEGKRMRSSLPKVLHPVAGLPMVAHVLKTASQAGANDQALVIGNQAKLVRVAVENCGFNPSIHIQETREGTAHAVLAARDALTGAHDDVLVLYGDVPLIQTSTIEQARAALAEGADIVDLGFETADPTGYGRLIMEGGTLLAIREEKDANEAERKITFCNSGIMAFRGEHVLDVLDAIKNNNAQGEYYLTDAVEVGRSRGLKTVAITVPEDETLGVNDRVQLAEIENRWQVRRREELLRSGVTMQAPDTVWLHHDTRVAADCVIEPNVVFGAGVTLEQGVTIRAFSHLEDAVVGPESIVGPYARLRPGTVLGRKVKVGNFVETKKAVVADGAKINHLSYVGDANVGAAANIGAGTVTCNYDGFNKHVTVIGAGAFIGTNTSLVAPVIIGDNANTAAGSVIYQDVADDDLAIERSKQINLPGKAKSLRDRNKATKDSS